MIVGFITSEEKRKKALTLTSPRYPPYQRNEDYAGGVGSGGGLFVNIFRPGRGAGRPRCAPDG